MSRDGEPRSANSPSQRVDGHVWKVTHTATAQINSPAAEEIARADARPPSLKPAGSAASTI